MRSSRQARHASGTGGSTNRFRSLGRVRLAAAAAAVAVVSAGVATLPNLTSASAGNALPAVAQVPVGELTAIVSAATSCPALTPPRLAAQVLLTSRSDPSEGEQATQAGGVRGARATAAAADRRSEIFALARRTCEFVGRLRLAKVPGDAWRTAVAAEQVGLAAVVAERGIPTDVQSHVTDVESYAEAYARQAQFGGLGGPDAAPAPAAPPAVQPVPVPPGYLADVRAAGSRCRPVSPARVAGQLMVASAFDPALVGAGGQQGTAQFTAELWAQYGPASSSPLEPHAAIRALGTAMCDLVGQMSGLTTGDPYPYALAAYHWGTSAFRAAGGPPRSAAETPFSDLVLAYADRYAHDARLLPAAPAPKRSAARAPGHPAPPEPRPSTLPTARPSTGPAPRPSPTRPPTTPPSASTPLPYDPTVSYRITNAFTGSVLEMPAGATRTGVVAQLWRSLGGVNQRWSIAAAPVPGYFTITNAQSGKALAVRNGAPEDDAPVDQVVQDGADPSQQWDLRSAGGGQVWIVNHRSGKTLNVPGFNNPPADGVKVNQWTWQPTAANQTDQRWAVARW